MNVPISAAKAQLTDLVRRAEAGEEVVLTRRGQPAVQLTPAKRERTPEEITALLKEIGRKGKAEALPGPCAARSADFLYDEDGLPA